MDSPFDGIVLRKDSNTALYIQLYEKLKDMITGGVLYERYRLPSVRGLSKLLGVNQITVVSAYRLLEENGLVFSRPGSGTYVLSTVVSEASASADGNSLISDELYQLDDISVIKSGQIEINERTVNFASATPTPDLFPVEDFKTVLDEVLERDKGNAFGYQESQGYYPLRECIFEALSASIYGGSPESIQVISGAQQGIDIISKALLGHGDCIIAESPTYTGAIAVFKSRGADIVEIEAAEEGPNINTLEYCLKKYRPRLIYTIPSFQNPTGFSWPNRKREELLRLAERYNAYIIEDDYVSDLDFEGRSYKTIKSMDRYNRVIFIKSFSKIFMPGLRLGFMAVPSGILDRITQAKHTTDISTSGLMQRAFDLYMRKGFWSRHLAFMHSIYKERYHLAVKALDEHLPGFVRYYRPGGGLNIWLDLPYGFPVNSLLKSAVSRDIVFAPGGIFYSNTSQKLNNMRISFAAVHASQVYDGIEKLCGIIGAAGKTRGESRSMPLM